MQDGAGVSRVSREEGEEKKGLASRDQLVRLAEGGACCREMRQNKHLVCMPGA